VDRKKGRSGRETDYFPLLFPYLQHKCIGALIVDKLGPKRTIILGFLLQALVGFILSGVYNKLKTNIAGFAVMYGLYLSLGELGPGNNLGLLAAKATGKLASFYEFADSASDAVYIKQQDQLLFEESSILLPPPSERFSHSLPVMFMSVG
jgi:hypothetical protein